jgi:putative endonuclease
MEYYVYILTTRNNKVMYVGMTNNLVRRIKEHKQKQVEGFTQKYNVTKLVYYESAAEVKFAIEREKQIKGWLRRKKNALVETMNPTWLDLGEHLE